MVDIFPKAGAHTCGGCAWRLRAWWYGRNHSPPSHVSELDLTDREAMSVGVQEVEVQTRPYAATCRVAAVPPELARAGGQPPIKHGRDEPPGNVEHIEPGTRGMR